MTFTQALALLVITIPMWFIIKWLADNFDNDGSNGGGKK